VIKLLLLGTGDSGKSTFIKQLRRIYQDGFTETEREKFTDVLRQNTLEAMQMLLSACEEWKLKFTKSEPLTDEIDLVNSAQDLTPDVAKAVIKLWKSKPLKAAWDRESELSLPGGRCASFYFEHAKRFAAEDFVPTDDDICRAKLRTSGILETTFEMDEAEFVLIDVGGQRGERRKWVGCFEDVTAVIYLSAINEFDMCLEEDPSVNRLEESLRLFTTVSGAKWFNVQNSPTLFILFMNKSDLFEEKIKRKPLTTVFGDSYTQFEKKNKRNSMNSKLPTAEPLDTETTFIGQMFKANYKGQGPLCSYKTCALDTENCKKIFLAVRDQAVNEQLRKQGL